jgi:membrane protein DedA with SNARE-associated domain
MFTLISQIIARSGLGGVFLLMLVENLVPIIPSELILPFAGFEASRGAFSAVSAIGAGAAGSIIGGVAWYGIGRRFGLDRLRRLIERGGRWVAVTPEELDRAMRGFERWSGTAVFIGRMLPGVRALICIPAGIARMSFWRFLISSSLGATAWSALLVGAGLMLGAHYDVLERWLNPITDGLILLGLAIYIYRVVQPPARRA